MFSNDLKLIERCLSRDFRAWEVFIKKYSPLIQRSITNRLKKYAIPLNSDQVSDISQGLFLDIWEHRKLEKLTKAESLRYWLSIVSGNYAIEYCRKKIDREKHEFLTDFKDLDRQAPSDKLPSDAIKEIDKAIESLPDKEKIVIKLNVLESMRQEEIADMLHIPLGTVSSYIKRGKDRLKNILKNLQEF